MDHFVSRRTPLDSDWCRMFGLIGWPVEVQQVLLTALVSGQNLLFCSRHGAGKTLICSRVAALLDIPFRSVDCAKHDLADLVGYISPLGLQKGCVEYIRTELSLWNAGFLLLDEWNRSRPQTQNTYAELLYGRTLQGIPLESLRYVWAAMNPMDGTYSGTQEELDLALLSRFVFIVEPPTLETLDDDQFHEAIDSWADADAPLLAQYGARSYALPEVVDLIDAARKRFPSRMDVEGPIWAEYLSHLIRAIKSHAPRAADRLDMRSMKCAHRAILARRSLPDTPPNDAFDPRACHQEVGALMPYLFPALRLLDGNLSPFPWDTVHLMAADAAFGLHQLGNRASRERLTIETCALAFLPDRLQEAPEIFYEKEFGRIIVRRLTLSLQSPLSPGMAGVALATLLRLLALLPDDAPLSSHIVRNLAHLEDSYLTEDPAKVADLAEAMSIPPDALDEDPFLRICLTYIACREYGMNRFSQGWPRLWNYCKQVRDDPEEARTELGAMHFSLQKELARAAKEGDPAQIEDPGSWDLAVDNEVGADLPF